MAGLHYLDFDLFVERAEGGYRARVLSSPAGQASVQFSIPSGSLDLEQSEVGPPPAAEARAFGTRLFDAVFRDELRACLRSSQDAASRQGMGLRIRLRLTDVPELASLPWEYLYYPTINRFFALSAETPLVRYLDLSEQIRPFAAKPPLKLLAVIAAPTDQPPLDVEREWAILTAAMGDLELRGLVAVQRAEGATLAALARQLRQGEYHILHFVGHGGFDEQAQNGLLVLEDEARRSHPVTGEQLGTFLHDHRSLRLAVLNACEGARGAAGDPFAGVAQGLVQQGIPAVIAMQFAITEAAATAFASQFYGAVTDGYPVDAALAYARKLMPGQNSAAEWGTPVLYMRVPDGHVFEVERLSDEAQRRNQVAALLRVGQAAMAGDDWPAAMVKLQAALALDPAHAEATALLRKARQQRELDDLYARGREHYDAGRWREALDYFNRVREIGGNYRGVIAFILTCQRRVAEQETHDVRPPAPAPEAENELYAPVLQAVKAGRLVWFLGPRVNLCGRPSGIAWQAGQYLPDTGELAQHLAEAFGYPFEDDADLPRVSQYVTVMRDLRPLYEALHPIFDADYPLTLAHQFLAGLPGVLRGKGYSVPCQLIITTNYDDLLERAFREAGEPYDLLTYIAEGEQRGKFMHYPPGVDTPILVEKPNEYTGLPIAQFAVTRSLILKVHGAVDRGNPDQDNYVITEDHYIDYLPRMDISNLAPAPLLSILRRAYFLFLGYDLRAWNLRTFLHRIWNPKRGYDSWAVEPTLRPMISKFWSRHGVDIVNMGLEEYIAGLSEVVQAQPGSGRQP